MSEVALNKNLKRFADEYLVDLNGTRAYQATHPASKSEAAAAVGASRLLRNPKVSAYIAEKMMQREQRTEITQDRVLRELADVGFSKASDGPESDLKYSSKLRALELMGKHLGMFGTLDVKVQGALPVQIVDDLSVESSDKGDMEDGEIDPGDGTLLCQPS